MAFLLNRAKEARQGLQTRAAQIQANIPSAADTTKKFSLGNIVGSASNALGLSNPALKHEHECSVPIREGNVVKFHVAGCAYFWAVSEALEKAQSTIWIQGWWLSPEVYLRRPPSENENYRLDRMLTAAAERGVKINIIVYKEVPQTVHLESHHTKSWLESCHKNIQVFRHPNWYASGKAGVSGLNSLAEGLIEKALALAGLPIPGWTHHEKLVVVDSQMALMGGIDLCYGRWDPIQHPIADVHPENLDQIVYPGQDYNNGRVKDFANLANWQKNSLDRLSYSRMGWADTGFSVTGPVLQDICAHFEHRWNFIYEKKYNTPGIQRTTSTPVTTEEESNSQPSDPTSTTAKEASSLAEKVQGPPYFAASSGPENNELEQPGTNFKSHLPFSISPPEGEGHKTPTTPTHGPFLIPVPKETNGTYKTPITPTHGPFLPENPTGGVNCQFLRSASVWSNGTSTERSIYHAYIETIKNSEHYIYIENQFFTTKSSALPLTVWNRVGDALVERIVRAAKSGARYKVFVVMPSVMVYPGELVDPRAFPARLTMKQNYHAINQGLFFPNVYSSIRRAGYNPEDYIRFYNLRTYDRINAGEALHRRELRSETTYDAAGADHDDMVDSFGTAHAAFEGAEPTPGHEAYNRYQAAGSHKGSGWNTVSSCYMKAGTDIRKVPWTGTATEEVNAFVSEQLYVHSKLLIADDRVVICGSANLNDRSMKGTRDSEIALYIEDSRVIASTMDGKPYEAREFAATMRRYVFRKHLGLLAPQDMRIPDGTFHVSPSPSDYDFGTEADKLVVDPLGDDFLSLWQGTAKTNTETFWKVFAPAPDNSMHFWAQYVAQAAKRKLGFQGEALNVHLMDWGHVMRPNFPAGEESARQVKELLAKIRGTLVEMPLDFMKHDDIELAWWNPLTQVVTA
ncbi:hypothetical protein BKA65DRAFT_602424 [Rhexocercosporidium sp. MPI-PUGE-AT-0058]|nr:hypothetical protein BKA65DRAFT_602424 [Rhexocercosporidium sp. MPI-PUGE-AT-0058]